MADLTVRSDTFDDGADIPVSAAHPSAGGGNTSPHLAWDGVPEGTKSIGLTCWDPDAPTTVGFSHWVRSGIAPTTTERAEGSKVGVDGITDWGETGYGGMAPPPGDPAHHYIFTVYALDSEASDLGLDDHATYAKFRFLIRGH